VARAANRLTDLGRIVIRRFDEDGGMQIAASLTYTTLLALVPLITVALTVIAAFPVFADLTAALEEFILMNLLPTSVDVVASHMRQFSAAAARLTAVGVGFLFVTAIMLLLTIDRAFNDIWRVRRTRPLVQRLLVYWTLLTVGPVLIGASISLTSWLVGEIAGLVRGLPGVAVVLLSLVPVLLTSTALALLYMAMPNRRIALRDAVIGGLIAGIVFELMKHGFAAYFAYFPTYRLVYGAFAAVPVFLLWVYLSWLVVVFAAVVVAALPEWRAGAGQRLPVPGSDFFDSLQILKILWAAHREGQTVRFADLLAACSVRIERVESILATLMSVGWVSRTAPAGWTLHRSAETIQVETVYHLFVMRGEAHVPAPAADANLDTLVHELGALTARSMRISLADLFRAAERGEGLPQPAEVALQPAH
jgi:membrane protein